MGEKPKDSQFLRDVAEAIADGKPVDWDALRAACGADAERIEKLRIVEQVANAYHDEHARDSDAPPAARDGGADNSGTGPGIPAITVSHDMASSGADAPRRVAATETPLFSWGRLRVLERIGRGAFADVYRAYDPSLRLEVALKLQRDDVPLDERSEKRCLAEARKLAKARHENILTVHGVDVHDRRVGIWTDLVRGKTLAGCVEEHGLFGADEAACIGMNLCGALAELHRVGLVHRDLKPTNVMREEGGQIILMDFGSACTALPEAASDRHTVTGTPLTTAPEVLLHGEQPKPTQDIYGLGVLLYWLVCGRYPVEATKLDDLVRKHERGNVARPLMDLRPDVAPAIAHVIERALAPQPEERYQTPGEMQRALTAALGARGRDAKGARLGRRPLFLAAATVLAVVASSAAVIIPRLRTAPQVQAALYREDAQSEERLADGGRIRPNEQLFLEILFDRPMHVWIVDEDERGKAWVLFPLGDGANQELAPGKLHRLPGDVGGVLTNWATSDEAGRETILVVAATERLPQLERQLAGLPRASGDDIGLSDPLPAGGDIPRGVERLVSRTPGTNGRGVVARLLHEYGDKQGRGGVWLWKLQLVNDGS